MAIYVDVNGNELKRLPPHKSLDMPRDLGHYIIAGPKTFRRGCRKFLSNKRDTPFNNFGGNRQNIEKKMRKVWIADDGYDLINADQSGADALIVALLCKPGNYRDLFIYGIKPHTYTALQRFNNIWKKHFNPEHIDIACTTEIKELVKLPFWKPLASLIKSSDDWSAPERYYYFGKKIRHAGAYGMQANKLRASLTEETAGAVVIDKAEAERWLLEDDKDFPELKRDFQMGVLRSARTGVLRNLFGHPFYLTEKLNENDLNDLYSWIPQCTVACITLNAYVALQDYIEENDLDWHILQETHDSITLEAPESESLTAAKMLQQFLGQELTSPVDGFKYTMRSECQIGKNWSPCSDKNPLGLKEVR